MKKELKKCLSGKGMNGQIPDMKILILHNLMKSVFRKILHIFHSADRICSSTCSINRNVVSACHHPQTADMIRMLMSDKNRVNVPASKLQLVQSLLDPFAAYSCIYKNMGLF